MIATSGRAESQRNRNERTGKQWRKTELPPQCASWTRPATPASRTWHKKRGIPTQGTRQAGDSGTKTEVSQEEDLQTRRSRRIETASNKESPGHEVAAIQLPSRPAFSSGITRDSCHNWALRAYFLVATTRRDVCPQGGSKLGCTFRPRSPLRPISRHLPSQSAKLPESSQDSDPFPLTWK